MKIKNSRLFRLSSVKQLLSLQVFLRTTWVLNTLGFALAVISVLFPSIPAGFLCIFFFFSWILWNICAWIEISNGKWMRIFYLWALIDVSILFCFLSVGHSIGDVSGSPGTEMVWGVAYIPSILPFGLAINMLSDSFRLIADELLKMCVSEVGALYGKIIGNWLLMSLVSMFQCCVVCTLLYLFRQFSKISPPNFEVIGKFFK